VTRIKGNSGSRLRDRQAPSADAAVRKIVAEYQIDDPELLEADGGATGRLIQQL
jgi:hypothetical protein